MNNANRLLVGLVVASVSLLVIVAGTLRAADSGIDGVITVSPSRPGPTRPGDLPAPVANIAFVVKKGDEKVSSFTTDAAGHFHVVLPPGQYVVSREDPGARIGRWQFEAIVEAGKMTAVHWTGDSGMR